MIDLAMIDVMGNRLATGADRRMAAAGHVDAERRRR
jgi:hypothetical protein